MMDINDLIKLVQGNQGSINVHITVTPTAAPVVERPVLPDTDFEVGQEVLVCHTRKDGTPVHTYGVVDTVCGQDDYGWYTRVTGENGKHYRAGLKYNEERKGTLICLLED